MNVLEEIVESTRHEVEARRQAVPQSQLEQALAGRGEDRPFAEALARPGLSLIAEYKRRSPAAGALRPDAAVTEIVQAYERGAQDSRSGREAATRAKRLRWSQWVAPAATAGLLVLDAYLGEQQRGPAGLLDDLREARAASTLPILRKDFTVDAYQLYESAAAGADAVLLIVAAVRPDELEWLHREAQSLDLDVLVEVHDERELDAALEIDAALIGINNRDLSDFSVDVERTYQLLSDVPAGKVVVSESGFDSREQLDDLDRVGVDAVLVGASLMRAPDVEAACRALTGENGEGEL